MFLAANVIGRAGKIENIMGRAGPGRKIKYNDESGRVGQGKFEIRCAGPDCGPFADNSMSRAGPGRGPPSEKWMGRA